MNNCLKTSKINLLKKLIDNSVNEFVKLTSAFITSGPIVVWIDGIIFSTLDIKKLVEFVCKLSFVFMFWELFYILTTIQY